MAFKNKGDSLLGVKRPRSSQVLNVKARGVKTGSREAKDLRGYHKNCTVCFCISAKCATKHCRNTCFVAKMFSVVAFYPTNIERLD